MQTYAWKGKHPDISGTDIVLQPSSYAGISNPALKIFNLMLGKHIVNAIESDYIGEQLVQCGGVDTPSVTGHLGGAEPIVKPTSK